VLGEEARENGLKYSLLERLQARYKECGGRALQHMVSLNTNYRCPSEVVKIPNQLFYEGRVKTSPLIASANNLYPLKFVCSSLSANSNHETELILEEIGNYVSQHRTPYREICMVTASRPQVMKRKQVLY